MLLSHKMLIRSLLALVFFLCSASILASPIQNMPPMIPMQVRSGYLAHLLAGANSQNWNSVNSDTVPDSDSYSTTATAGFDIGYQFNDNLTTMVGVLSSFNVSNEGKTPLSQTVYSYLKLSGSIFDSTNLSNGFITGLAYQRNRLEYDSGEFTKLWNPLFGYAIDLDLSNTLSIGGEFLYFPGNFDNKNLNIPPSYISLFCVTYYFNSMQSK